MADMAHFEAITRGTASPQEAREIVAAALREDDGRGTAQRLYTALRAWTWKALDGRRRDDDLRQWFDLLKRVESALSERQPAHAERVRVLHELVHESISAAEIAALPAP